MRCHQGADAGDARRDQHDVGDGAHRDYRQHVLATDALAQHERVLGADRGDQCEAGEEADQQWGTHAIDGMSDAWISTANDSSAALAVLMTGCPTPSTPGDESRASG
jgi:hypothetical protein